MVTEGLFCLLKEVTIQHLVHQVVTIQHLLKEVTLVTIQHLQTTWSFLERAAILVILVILIIG